MNNTAPSNKVVSLSDYDRARKSVGVGEASLLVECRDMAADLLSRSLSKMLDRIEESLFELAEGALNSEVRSLYLEARGKALAHRAAVESEFRKTFVMGFNKRIGSESRDTVFSRLDASSIELSLVDADDFEASLAATDIAKRMKDKSGDELTALERRMGALMSNPDLEGEDNPISPDAICNAFKEACNQLESSVNVKLIILKQFDLLVNDDIQLVYQNLNKHLIQRNVLPSIPPELLHRRPMAGVRPAPVKTQESAVPVAENMGAGASNEQELFSTLQQLLSKNNAAALTGGSAGFSAAPAGGFPDLNPSVMDTGSVLNILNSLQHGDVDAMLVQGLSPDALSALSGNTNILRDLKEKTSIGRTAGQVDSMTIDIVAMLFDYVFDDRHIPDKMKALIGRLQIPVLKVAMLDKKFFSKKTHPARKLLDGMAQAALGWTEHDGEDDRLYKKIDEIVHQILGRFEDSMDVFDAACGDLETFLHQEEELAQERAENSAQVIYDREWLDIAKAMAEEEIKRRIVSNEMPEVIRQLLSTHWANLLLSAYAKEGAESDAWKFGVQTMDDLIWSALPKRSAEDRMRLVNMLPGMLKRLEQALEINRTPKEEREKFFSELVHCHAAAIKAGMVPQKVAEPLAEKRPVEVKFDLPSIKQEELDPLLRELVPVEKLASQSKSAANFEMDLINSANLRNPENIAKLQTALSAENNTNSGDQFDRLAARLPRGCWIEFAVEDGTKLRAKLTWISPMKGVYLFTNRQGLNAMTIKLSGLASKFRKGSARVLEEEPIVDRAVSNMLDVLKSGARA